MLSGAGSGTWVERRLRPSGADDDRSRRSCRSIERPAARTRRRRRLRGHVRNRRPFETATADAVTQPCPTGPARADPSRSTTNLAAARGQTPRGPGRSDVADRRLHRPPRPIRRGRSPATGSLRCVPRCALATSSRRRWPTPPASTRRSRSRSSRRWTTRSRWHHSTGHRSRNRPRMSRKPRLATPPHPTAGTMTRAVRPRGAVRTRTRQPDPRRGVPDVRRPPRDRRTDRDDPPAAAGHARAGRAARRSPSIARSCSAGDPTPTPPRRRTGPSP